jgi:hypothetical protein
MTRRNWRRNNERALMRARGTESAKDETPFMAPLVPRRKRRPRLSKADLRADADAAIAEWRRRNGASR